MQLHGLGQPRYVYFLFDKEKMTFEFQFIFYD